MDIFKKIFIKDYRNTSNPQVRFRYGVTAGIFGIITNILLVAFKMAAGIIGSSITIIADAMNNISDAGSSVVTLVGFKLSSRPADKEHPFGHARYEYITALLMAVLVLVVGVLLLKTSIEKCITPQAVTVSAFTYAVLGVAIFLKIVQMLVYLNFAKSIDSGALKAAAADSRNDVLATSAVLVSTIIIGTTGVNIDGYMGIVVSLFIVISSLILLKDTINPLLGVKPDRKVVEQLKEKILSYEGVIGMHDLVIHNYGAANCFAVAHVEVPANVDVMKSHDVIDNIEHDIYAQTGIHLNIHMDPVDTENENLLLLKERAVAVLARLDMSLSLHDFRMVSGDTHTNLVFDVVIPYECSITLRDIKQAMKEEFANDEVKYFFVIDIDR